MKPRNWRTYSGWYRPQGYRIAVPPWRPLRERENDYIAWLADARGWPVEAARKYAMVQPKGPPLIVSHNGPMLEEVYIPPIAKPAKPPRVSVLTPAREVPVVEPVPEIARRRDAAALLRELAAGYGPRRAHKMRAMADFIEAPAALKVVNG